MIRGTARKILDLATGRCLSHTLARQRRYWSSGPTFVLSFDVETEQDCVALPALCARLAALALPASFACIGALVARFPEEHQRLVDMGFEVINHSESHPWHLEFGHRVRFDQLTDEEIEREVTIASERLVALGAQPQGFRTPHFGAQHTRRVYRALHRAALSYSTSTVASGMASGGAPFEVDGVWEFPVLACPRHPTVPLDSWHCTGAPDAAHRSEGDVLRMHTEAISLVERYGAYGSVYWDPAHLDHRYEAVLELLHQAADRVTLTTYAGVLRQIKATQIGAQARR